MAGVVVTWLDVGPVEKIFTDSYVVVTADQKWPMVYVISTANGEAADLATSVKKYHGTAGASTNMTCRLTSRGDGPVAIRANKSSSGTPVKVKVIVFGDSITEGLWVMW